MESYAPPSPLVTRPRPCTPATASPRSSAPTATCWPPRDRLPARGGPGDGPRRVGRRVPEARAPRARHDLSLRWRSGPVWRLELDRRAQLSPLGAAWPAVEIGGPAGLSSAPPVV